MPESSKPGSQNPEEACVVSAIYVAFPALQATLRHELTGERIEATLTDREAAALLRQLAEQVEPSAQTSTDDVP